MEVIMRLLIILFFTVFLVACNLPLGFEGPSTPDYVGDLNSRVTEGETDSKNKIRIPKGKGKGKRRSSAPHKRVVQDMVVPKPVPTSPTSSEEPPWVGDLKKEVEVKKIGKGKRPITQDINQDLVGEVSATALVPVVTRKRNSKVDIIFVVDASGSMMPFLRKVSSTFAHFTSALESLDWQIMFTVAAYGGFLFPDKGRAMRLERDGKLLWETRFLTKDIVDYDTVFIDTLRLQDPYEYLDDRMEQEKSSCLLSPGCQSGNEQPLRALKSAFVQNRSFFRPGADVVAVIFSDSDEGERTRPDFRATAQDVLDGFNQQWGQDNKKFIGYGIIMIPGEDQDCMKKHSSGWWAMGEGLFGTELARLAQLTGGKNYSICSSSYTSLANQITLDFSK